MSASNPTRSPVTFRGRRVPNLYSRTKADGSVVYEHAGKLNGKVKRVVLDAASVSEAVEAVEELRSGIRSRRIAIAEDRRKLVRDAVPEYLAHLDTLTGTKRERSPRSIEDIASKLNRYIVPAIGHQPVASVDERDIRDLARSRTVAKLSKATVQNILSTASGFFAWAVREKLATTNVVRLAREKFGDELLPASKPKPLRTLTDDEISAALEHVSETFLPIVQVTVETGLRISEVIGLTWGRCDLDGANITVAQQLDRDGTIRPVTKNKVGRTIPISTKCAAVLRAQKAAQAEAGYSVAEGALVFTTKAGKHQSRRNTLRSWQGALRRIGVEDAGLHSLRASFVSRLAEQNVPVTVAAELVGHARVTTTQDHYLRMRGNQEARIEAMREVLA